ncbi:hypothetical protein FOA52_013088 [Chlamydomonas sp. UWO 241]|nr:hypothetical protein FOA52_013088 [Chlamydomonas sp. UWO 241]
MRKMQHAHIVKFVGVGARNMGSLSGVRSSVYVVQEAMLGGDLSELVAAQAAAGRPWEKYSAADALAWLTQIADALAYLHDTVKPMVIHRDLKLSNVLLSGDGVRQGGSIGCAVAKLCDFGSHKRARAQFERGLLLPVDRRFHHMHEASRAYELSSYQVPAPVAADTSGRARSRRARSIELGLIPSPYASSEDEEDEEAPVAPPERVPASAPDWVSLHEQALLAGDTASSAQSAASGSEHGGTAAMAALLAAGYHSPMTGPGDGSAHAGVLNAPAHHAGVLNSVCVGGALAALLAAGYRSGQNSPRAGAGDGSAHAGAFYYAGGGVGTGSAHGSAHAGVDNVIGAGGAGAGGADSAGSGAGARGGGGAHGDALAIVDAGGTGAGGANSSWGGGAHGPAHAGVLNSVGAGGALATLLAADYQSGQSSPKAGAGNGSAHAGSFFYAGADAGGAGGSGGGALGGGGAHGGARAGVAIAPASPHASALYANSDSVHAGTFSAPAAAAAIADVGGVAWTGGRAGGVCASACGDGDAEQQQQQQARGVSIVHAAALAVEQQQHQQEQKQQEQQQQQQQQRQEQQQQQQKQQQLQEQQSSVDMVEPQPPQPQQEQQRHEQGQQQQSGAGMEQGAGVQQEQQAQPPRPPGLSILQAAVLAADLRHASLRSQESTLPSEPDLMAMQGGGDNVQAHVSTPESFYRPVYASTPASSAPSASSMKNHIGHKKNTKKEARKESWLKQALGPANPALEGVRASPANGHTHSQPLMTAATDTQPRTSSYRSSHGDCHPGPARSLARDSLPPPSPLGSYGHPATSRPSAAETTQATGARALSPLAPQQQQPLPPIPQQQWPLPPIQGVAAAAPSFLFPRGGMPQFADATRAVGSPLYMAPEMAAGGRYNEAVDVFAFAILAWELISGVRIADREEFATGGEAALAAFTERRASGEREVVPKAWPAALRRMISECWAEDPTLRPRAAAVARDLRLLVAADGGAAVRKLVAAPMGGGGGGGGGGKGGGGAGAPAPAPECGGRPGSGTYAGRDQYHEYPHGQFEYAPQYAGDQYDPGSSRDPQQDYNDHHEYHGSTLGSGIGDRHYTMPPPQPPAQHNHHDLHQNQLRASLFSPHPGGLIGLGPGGLGPGGGAGGGMSPSGYLYSKPVTPSGLRAGRLGAPGGGGGGGSGMLGSGGGGSGGGNGGGNGGSGDGGYMGSSSSRPVTSATVGRKGVRPGAADPFPSQFASGTGRMQSRGSSNGDERGTGFDDSPPPCAASAGAADPFGSQYSNNSSQGSPAGRVGVQSRGGARGGSYDGPAAAVTAAAVNAGLMRGGTGTPRGGARLDTAQEGVRGARLQGMLQPARVGTAPYDASAHVLAGSVGVVGHGLGKPACPASRMGTPGGNGGLGGGLGGGGPGALIRHAHESSFGPRPSSARPQSARPGSARPGSARPGSAYHGGGGGDGGDGGDAAAGGHHRLSAAVANMSYDDIPDADDDALDDEPWLEAATARRQATASGYGMTLDLYMARMKTTPASAAATSGLGQVASSNIPVKVARQPGPRSAQPQHASTGRMLSDNHAWRHVPWGADDGSHAHTGAAPGGGSGFEGVPTHVSPRASGGRVSGGAMLNSLDLRPATAAAAPALLRGGGSSDLHTSSGRFPGMPHHHHMDDHLGPFIKETDLGHLSASLFTPSPSQAAVAVVAAAKTTGGTGGSNLRRSRDGDSIAAIAAAVAALDAVSNGSSGLAAARPAPPLPESCTSPSPSTTPRLSRLGSSGALRSSSGTALPLNELRAMQSQGQAAAGQSPPSPDSSTPPRLSRLGSSGALRPSSGTAPPLNELRAQAACGGEAAARLPPHAVDHGGGAHHGSPSPRGAASGRPPSASSTGMRAAPHHPTGSGAGACTDPLPMTHSGGDAPPIDHFGAAAVASPGGGIGALGALGGSLDGVLGGALFGGAARVVQSARPVTRGAASGELDASVWERGIAAQLECRPPSRQKPPPEALHLWARLERGNGDDSGDDLGELGRATLRVRPATAAASTSYRSVPSSSSAFFNASASPGSEGVHGGHSHDVGGGLSNSAVAARHLPPSRQKPPPMSVLLETGEGGSGEGCYDGFGSDHACGNGNGDGVYNGGLAEEQEWLEPIVSDSDEGDSEA